MPSHTVLVPESDYDHFLSLLDEDQDCFTFACIQGTCTHHYGTIEELSGFLSQCNSEGADIFVVINHTGSKLAKDSAVSRIRAVFADDDNSRNAHRVDWPAEPHVIVESSPGKYHYYWLVENLPPSEFSGIQRAISEKYGTDKAVSNLARLMRLPGFTNNKSVNGSRKYPDFTCRIVAENKVQPYSADKIRNAFPPDRTGNLRPMLGSDDVIRALQDKGLYLHSAGNGRHDITCPWAERHTDDRPEAVYFEANTGGYSGAGYKCHHSHCANRTMHDLNEVLELPNNRLSPAIRGGLIDVSTTEAEQQFMAKMNREWAMLNGQILHITPNNDPARSLFQRFTPQRFQVQMANQPQVLTQTGGRTPLEKFWLQHQGRRECTGIGFYPQSTPSDHINLFQGYPVTSIRGDCSLFTGYLRDIVCAGNPEVCEYVLSWLAHIFQKPADKPGKALVLRGGEGTGKSSLGTIIGRLLGRHYFESSHLEQILGKFNMHLMDKLLVMADDAIWGGDKKQVGNLKAFITQNVIAIEQKGYDIIQMPHYARLIVTSNESWAVHAGQDARRFVFLDVSHARRGDTEYFGALYHWLENGGFSALMALFLARDLSGFDPRCAPDTGFGQDLKQESMSVDEEFWFEVLKSGEIPVLDRDGSIVHFSHTTDDWANLPKGAIYDAFCRQSRERSVRHVPKTGTFWNTLYRMLGLRDSEEKKTLHGGKISWGGRRTNALKLPPLDTLRSSYDAENKTITDWDAD